MLGIVLALVASVSYGVSDFFGGLAASRRGAVSATLAVYCAGTVVTLLALAVLPWSLSAAAVVAGLMAGVLAIVGFLTFYVALAIGPMSVLSPTIALVTTAVPVLAALALGETLSALGWVGVALALAAGVLVSVRSGEGGRVERRGLIFALVSGLFLGSAIVALDTAPSNSGILPGVIDTMVGTLALAPVALMVRRSTAPFLRGLDTPESTTPMGRGRFLLVSGLGGVLLGLANLLIVLALQAGELTVVSVVVSLYPVVTMILAASVLRERLSRMQLLGVVAALAAAVLLSVG